MSENARQYTLELEQVRFIKKMLDGVQITGYEHCSNSVGLYIALDLLPKEKPEEEVKDEAPEKKPEEEQAPKEEEKSK